MTQVFFFIFFGCLAIYFLLPIVVKRIICLKFLSTVKKTGLSCLTFDDGPNPETTPEILELLKEADVKATFFLIGNNVQKYPELADQIFLQGHEIGEHSFEHSHAWKSDPIRTAIDLTRGNRTISKYRSPGEKISFRPPYGKVNLITLLYILFSKRRVVFWNVDPKDYGHESSKVVSQYVTHRLLPGSVILLHDGRLNSSSDSNVTVSAVRSILKEAAHRNLRLTSIREVLNSYTNKRLDD